MKMNRLLIALLFSVTSIASYAATSTENQDDGSTLGTAENPQVKMQQNRTDKGATDVHQGGVIDDASNLGNSDTPQAKQQNKRTNKGVSESPSKESKNPLIQRKNENAGTTKGNPMQPTEPESAPPTTN